MDGFPWFKLLTRLRILKRGFIRGGRYIDCMQLISFWLGLILLTGGGIDFHATFYLYVTNSKDILGVLMLIKLGWF